jgi:hypothetical protein
MIECLHSSQQSMILENVLGTKGTNTIEGKMELNGSQ